jgi:hypothetical protein
MRVNPALDRWREVKHQQMQPATWVNDEWVARKNVRPALGDRKIGTLRPNQRPAQGFQI